MFEIAIRTRGLSGYVRIGNGARHMVDWNEIERQKNEERARVSEDAANREDERTRVNSVISKFARGMFDVLESGCEQRNMDILLPGQRISVNPMGPLSVQVARPTKAAIMTVEIEQDHDAKWLLRAGLHGLGATGMPEEQALEYRLSVVGFDVAISRATGSRGGAAVLTRDMLADNLLSAFAYYAV
jgi:hypothetical protein